MKQIKGLQFRVNPFTCSCVDRQFHLYILEFVLYLIFFLFPKNERDLGKRCQKKFSIGLIDHFIGAAATCKSLRFGLECKAHSQYVSHCFFEGIVTFKMRVGINICMNFHFYIIKSKKIIFFIDVIFC